METFIGKWLKDKIFKTKHPFKTKESMVFNSLEEGYDSHPIILFKEPNDIFYYYLKSRSAFKKDESRDILPQEVYVPRSKNKNAYFSQDSLVDCSQIFKIEEDDLNDFLTENPDVEKSDAQELDYQYVVAIFNKMSECLQQKPPFAVISQIRYNREAKKLESQVVYANEWHLKKDLKNFKRKRNFKEQMDAKLKKQEIINRSNIKEAKWVLEKNIAGLNDYWEQTIYIPLAKWIVLNSDNFSNKKPSEWNSKIILKQVNNSVVAKKTDNNKLAIIPDFASWNNISIGLEEIKRNDLLEKIYQSDFKYMLDWMVQKKLALNNKSFEVFKQEQEKDNIYEHKYAFSFFDYDELEERFDKYLEKQKLEKQEISKKHWDNIWDRHKEKDGLKDKTKDDDGWSQGM